jgi:3-hydroxyisobutyrate dehydrogenase-like beta-hydroxyacid dehydrogenase
MTTHSQSQVAEPTVGVVGLGQMGGAIALNLFAAGFAVCGWDIDPTRVALLAAKGLVTAGSIQEIGAAQTVITSLPSEQALVATSRELAAIDSTDQVIIETSTLSVAAKEQAAAILAPSGSTLLDCPVSGTGRQALTGDLIVLASGYEPTVRGCSAVLDGFSRASYYVGPLGAGSRMKFVANLLVAIHNVAAAEALVLAESAGLDPALTLRVLSDSAGTSRMLEVRGPAMLSGDYSSGVSNRVFQKDLSLIHNFAAAHTVPTPLFALSAEVHQAATAKGFGELDTASVYEIVASLAGVEVPDRGAPHFTE